MTTARKITNIFRRNTLTRSIHAVFIIYWDYDDGLQDEDGKPLKEATLRIEAEGYDDPVTIKVKYPKRNAKKTIKFKHKKK